MAGRPKKVWPKCVWCDTTTEPGFMGRCKGYRSELCERDALLLHSDLIFTSWNMLRPGGWPDELERLQAFELAWLAGAAREAERVEVAGTG